MRIRRMMRDDSGQSLVLAALFLALVALVLLLGGLGMASAYRSRAHIQSAADAAALAAAREAVPLVTASIQVHDRACREEVRWRREMRPGPDGELVEVEVPYTVIECKNQPTRVVNAKDILPAFINGGWIAAAGCNATRDLIQLGSWTVCETWWVASHDGWAYPPGLSSPRRAAEVTLASNLAGLAAEWEITRFEAIDGSGIIRLGVRATLVDNPLSSIARRPVVLNIAAWSRPTGRVDQGPPTP